MLAISDEQSAHRPRSQSHEDFYSSVGTVLSRYSRELSVDVYNSTIDDIQHNLRNHGISFEGKTIPISLHPTILTEDDLKRATVPGALIRNVLMRVIDRFREAHLDGQLDSPLHAFFTPYYKWWDLIAKEKRSIPQIQLMRYDAIREPNGSWNIMENNTACPGGVIHCARIRDAFLMTRFGRSLFRGLDIQDFAVDSASGFLKFFIELAQTKSGSDQVNVAVCNYRGTYTNELESLRREHARLVELGEIPKGEFLIADIREVECDGDQASIRKVPVSLIYNKLDPLMIDPSNAEIDGWVRASRSENTDFLNGLGAMYLTESKRALALLSDPDCADLIELSHEEREAIDDLFPFTRVLPSKQLKRDEDLQLYELLKAYRHEFVVKADAMTRGQGVFIGAESSYVDWMGRIDSAKQFHGICQRTCNTPFRTSLIPISDSQDSFGRLIPIDEHFGVDLFYFGDRFGGAVSRSHTSKVFNVGAGGRESPTIILKGDGRV